MTSETQTQARNEPVTEAGRRLLYDPDEGYPVGLEEVMGRDATRWRDTLRDSILAIEADAFAAGQRIHTQECPERYSLPDTEQAFQEGYRVGKAGVDAVAALREQTRITVDEIRERIAAFQKPAGWSEEPPPWLDDILDEVAALPHDSTPGEPENPDVTRALSFLAREGIAVDVSRPPDQRSLVCQCGHRHTRSLDGEDAGCPMCVDTHDWDDSTPGEDR